MKLKLFLFGYAFAKTAFLTAMLVSSLMSGCTNSLTAQDRSELAEREGQESACIAAHAPDRGAIDVCRAAVKAKWDAKWAARFDAGKDGD
jgi:hypothetical protein